MAEIDDSTICVMERLELLRSIQEKDKRAYMPMLTLEMNYLEQIRMRHEEYDRYPDKERDVLTDAVKLID